MASPSARIAPLADRNSTEQLVSLNDQRIKLQRRVTGSLLLLGVSLLLCGFVADILMEEGAFGRKRDALACQLIWAPGIPVVLLSILPTYRTSIRTASVLCLLFALAGISNSIEPLLASVEEVVRRPLPVQMVHTDMIIWAVYLFVGLMGFTVAVNTLRCEQASRRLTMPPRLALRQMWLGSRCFALAFGTSLFITKMCIILVIEPSCISVPQTVNATPPGADNPINASFTDVQLCTTLAEEQPSDTMTFFVVFEWLTISLLTTPSNRGRAIAFIGRHLTGEDAASAATITSMLNAKGKSATATIRMAAKNFRAVPFSVLTEDDLKSNVDTGLNRKVIAAALGEVSVFVSHSWSDPARGKWATMSRWASGYKTKIGASPTLWLDKACIDQCNIEASLNCLPVYLAFCRGLLVLVGPTYTSRLWVGTRCIEQAP